MKILKFNEFLNEDYKPKSLDDLIEYIKTRLTEEEGEDSFKDFVDNQELGNCQGIVNSILSLKIQGLKGVFGEIEIDEPYIDDEGDEQNLMTHHWVEYKKQILDFSKNTLKDYIDLEKTDIYDPTDIEEWRYNKKYYKN